MLWEATLLSNAILIFWLFFCYVLQLLSIGFTQQNSCCISTSIVKYRLYTSSKYRPTFKSTLIMWALKIRMTMECLKNCRGILKLKQKSQDPVVMLCEATLLSNVVVLFGLFFLICSPTFINWIYTTKLVLYYMQKCICFTIKNILYTSSLILWQHDMSLETKWRHVLHRVCEYGHTIISLLQNMSL